MGNGTDGASGHCEVSRQMESAAGAWQVFPLPHVWQVPQSRSPVQAPPLHSPEVHDSPLPQSLAAAHQRAGA